MRKWNGKIRAERLLDVFYPRRCPVCDAAVPFGKSICPECEKTAGRIKEPWCLKCGAPLSEEREYCEGCEKKELSFDQGRSLFYYSGVKLGMYRMKNEGRREYADYFAGEMAKELGRWIMRDKPEVLIPVPLHAGRLKERGYNQAELIALGLGKRLGLPVEKELVGRVSFTRAAKRMSGLERARALKKAFKIMRNSVEWRNVLIIDDIFTTGATIDAVASVLRQAGVERIRFACAAAGGDAPNEA